MNKSLIIVFLFLGQWAIAQVPDSIKDLPAEQVEVIKQFEARLADARKVNTVPEPPAQRVLKQFNYDVSIKPLELEYLEPSIRPIALAQEEYPRKYNGFIKAAIGNLNTLNAALGYNFITKNETEINLGADYLAQENKNERFQKYSHLNTNLALNHNFNELLSFRLSGGYHQKNVGFYGSPVDEFIGADTSVFFRTMRDYGVGFSVFNAEENEYDFNYSLSADYKNFSLVDENLVENNFIAGLDVDKAFNNHFSLTFHGATDISSILDTATYSFNNYHLKPGISWYSSKVGLDAAVDFAFAPSGRNYYLPDMELSFSALNNSVIPYAFWKSELQKNNVMPLFQYNPFLSAGVTGNLTNSVVTRYGGGVKGKVRGLHYDVSVGYGETADLLLFRNNITTNGLRQFLLETDTAQVLDVDVGLVYEWSEKLDVRANIEYNSYSIVAWHLPAYKMDISATYRMLDGKLAISPSVFIRDGVIVLNDEREAEELPYMLDVNLHAAYKVAEQFEVFGEVNNLLASEYQQWYDYSNFGLNAKLGLRAKF